MTDSHTRQMGAATELDPVLHLEKWLPYRCSVIANAVSLRLARFYHGKFGLTVHGWRMMAVLGRSPPLAAIELARNTAMDQVSVTRAINHLMKLGMVTRGTDTKDRRRAVLRLSAKGRAAYEAVVPLARELEAVLTGGLSSTEVAQLNDLLSRVQHNVRQVGDAEPLEEEKPRPAKSRAASKTARRGAPGRIRKPYVF